MLNLSLCFRGLAENIPTEDPRNLAAQLSRTAKPRIFTSCRVVSKSYDKHFVVLPEKVNDADVIEVEVNDVGMQDFKNSSVEVLRTNTECEITIAGEGDNEFSKGVLHLVLSTDLFDKLLAKMQSS